MRKAIDNGLKEVQIRVTGPGSGRESALRALAGFEGVRYQHSGRNPGSS